MKLECVASAANLKRTASREEYQRKKVAKMLKDNRVVKSKEGKAYTPKMMKCVMELLTDNVNACRVSQAIQAVLKLADMTACHIPSNATVFNYNVARLVLAQRQLGEDLSREKNTTLLNII